MQSFVLDYDMNGKAIALVELQHNVFIIQLANFLFEIFRCNQFLTLMIFQPHYLFAKGKNIIHIVCNDQNSNFSSF